MTALCAERQVFKGHSYHLSSAHPAPSLQQTTLYSPPTPSPSLQGTGGQHPDTELEVFPSREKDTNRGGGQRGGGSVLHSGSTQKMPRPGPYPQELLFNQSWMGTRWQFCFSIRIKYIDQKSAQIVSVQLGQSSKTFVFV